MTCTPRAAIITGAAVPAGASAYKPAMRASERASERSGASGDNGQGDQSVNVNLNERRKKHATFTSKGRLSD